MSTLQNIRDWFRLFDFAVVDFVVSAVPIALTAHYAGFPAYRGAAAVLPISIATHALFAIDTPMTNQFFDIDNHFVLKAVVLLSLLVAAEGWPF
mgnify:FL=1